MKSPFKPLLEGKLCPTCKGNGRVGVNKNNQITVIDECPLCEGLGIIELENACPDCRGTGLVVDGEFDVNCPTCHGTGVDSPTASG